MIVFLPQQVCLFHQDLLSLRAAGAIAAGISPRCWCVSAVLALWGRCLKAWGELKAGASSNNQDLYICPARKRLR